MNKLKLRMIGNKNKNKIVNLRMLLMMSMVEIQRLSEIIVQTLLKPKLISNQIINISPFQTIKIYRI